MFQAYMDESEGADGTLVIGGFISTVEKWAQFSREWEELLPYGQLKNRKQPHGTALSRFKPHDERRPEGNAERFHFKMSEMAASEGGLERSKAFFG